MGRRRTINTGDTKLKKQCDEALANDPDYQQYIEDSQLFNDIVDCKTVASEVTYYPPDHYAAADLFKIEIKTEFSVRKTLSVKQQITLKDLLTEMMINDTSYFYSKDKKND